MTLPLVGALAMGILQVASPPPPAVDTVTPSPTGPWVFQAERAGPPVYGLASILPVGAAGDPEGRAGTAWLHAQVLEEALRTRLRFSPASIQVEVGRFATEISVLTPAASVARDLRELHGLVSGSAPPSQEQFEAAKASLIAQLRFEAGAPIREFEEARADLIYDGRWGGSLHGTTDALGALTWDEFTEWMEGIDREGLIVVSVGPPDPLLPLPGPVLPEGVLDRNRRGPTWAWTDARHERRVEPITNSWVTVDAPIRRDLDPTALALLVRHLEELLAPSPPDPGVFSAEVEVLRTPRGPVLSVTAAVAPEAASRWARRLESAVKLEDLGSWMGGNQFSWQRRRLRNTWLRREASPDAKALRIAWDLQAGLPPRDPMEEVARLHGGDLERLLSAVGPVRVLVYGPDLGASGSP